MTTDAQNEELEQAIADAELTEAEAIGARELVAQGGQITAVIPFLLSERDGGGDEPDEPIEQPGAGAREPSPKQLAALEKELIRHERRVHEVMGEFAAGMATCEHCGGIGLAEPSEPEPELQGHEWFKACETCAGIGLVLTGSKRPGNATKDCPACRGRGYLEALKDGQPLASAPSLAIAPPPPSETEPSIAAANGNGSAIEYGVPAWMGDPNLSGQ